MEKIRLVRLDKKVEFGKSIEKIAKDDDTNEASRLPNIE